MSIRLQCLDVARAALGEPLRHAGQELFYRCPNHHDQHPSLQINQQKNVWMCGPCGTRGNAWQLAAFVGKLNPEDKAAVSVWLRGHGILNGERPKASHVRCEPVAVYVYRDAQGNPLARKLRFEPGRNGRPKSFAWQRWEDGAWLDGLASVKTPLYRLVEIQNEPFVVVPEGEKDADAGAKAGLPTTTSGGTDSFRQDHVEKLRGKDVCIVADADEAGRAEAQKRAAMLYGKAASVRVLQLPGAKDLAEWIEHGGTREQFGTLYESAPEWQPATGAAILDLVFAFIRRFISLTELQARAVVLWMAHTHAIEAADCTPYLQISSAEKESGKTRLLEVLRLFVAHPWLTGRVSAAVLTRKIDAERPTLLLDESDAAFGGEREYAEVLRSILNTGYQRDGTASCCVGQGANINYKDFSTFCAKAIAGIGKLPDTVASRSIPIRLKRARRGEVERFRRREIERQAGELAAKLGAWCQSNIERLRGARPDVPPELSDRQADCCEPLLAIADLAGGDWPETPRRALVELCVEAQAADDSVGVRLLVDVHAIFAEGGVDRSSSEDLVRALVEIETSPWAEWSSGKPITKAKLGRLLGRFDIKPGTIRLDADKTAKGYYASDFKDAWARYLPPDPLVTPTSKGNNVTPPLNSGENEDSASVTEPSRDVSENARNANKNAPCDVVTLSEGTFEDLGDDEVRL